MTATSNDQSAATSDHEAATTVATAACTVEQAAAILGVSVTTVRRRIRSGALRAEEARRPQGPVWLVYVPADATEATTSDHQPPPTVATAPTTTPAADAMVSLIQTTIGTILGPLVAEQAALRQLVERQAGELRTLERENGRQGAELERAASTIVTLNAALEARTAPQAADASTEPPVPRWRSWVPWVLSTAALVAVVVLLTIPR